MEATDENESNILARECSSTCDNNLSKGGESDNSTLLYISVEYVDSKKNENILIHPLSQDSFSNCATPQVSPSDPNMSSAARYSPAPVPYQEHSENTLGPIIIQQYVSQDDIVLDDFANQVNSDSSLTNIQNEMPTGLQQANQQYDMVGTNINMRDEGMQLIQECEQQAVELLITDHTTGISYSINAQGLLVERSLEEDEQLLEAITPNPLLESDLLSLDDGTLKSELSQDISPAVITSVNEEVINDYINCLSNKNFLCDDSSKIHTRSTCANKVSDEEQLLLHVYNIMDKPILSRAEASLPEFYLSLSKIGEENAIFAKKSLPKGTQFGPLEGLPVLHENPVPKKNDHYLKYFIQISSSIYTIDVSDENNSNWMGFVRKAESYEEQNLIITQEGHDLFFTSTRSILPKEELKVGYSSGYAQQFNLELLKPSEIKTWPCFECSEKFCTSEELQAHLNVHDAAYDENTKPKRKYKKRLLSLGKSQIDIIECNMCNEPFSSNVKYNVLKNHLHEKHKSSGAKTSDQFTLYPCYQCNICDMKFKMEILLNIHKLEHDPDLSLEQTNHVCPQCQRKFPTRKQLVLHVTGHALPQKSVKIESFKCFICYKSFRNTEKLQRHMLVHGSDENKPLQCKLCKKRVLNKAALVCHLKSHSAGESTFECPLCKETFDHVLKLRQHIPKHAQNNQYTCPICKKVFHKYRIIKKHLKLHNDPKYECTQCTKKFTTTDNLKKHMLRHSDQREFLCSDCGKQFKRKDKLTEHIKKRHPKDRNIMEEDIPKKKKVSCKVEPTEFHRFIYKCTACLIGFKRRGMLVNHLAKRHPDIRPDSVPELNLPILQTTKNYFCHYCDKVYKSNSKRKVHILKNHPGAALPVNDRQKNNGRHGNQNSYSQAASSVTTRPKKCQWCHRQYASRAKLVQHIRKDHPDHVQNDLHLNQIIKEEHNESIATESLVNAKESNHDGLDQDKTTKKQSELTVQDDTLDKNDHITTDGNMTEITTTDISSFDIVDDSNYCHLSIDENGMNGAVDNHNTKLYQLLSQDRGILPPS